MNKTADQLSKELVRDPSTGGWFPKFIQTIETKITPIKNNFVHQEEKILSSDKIVILRLSRYTEDFYEMVYFSEVAEVEKYVVVPKGFLFKTPAPETEVEIQKMYDAHMLSNLGSKLRNYAGSVGSDPEIFAETEDGKLIPAFEFLPSKQDPAKGPANSYGLNDLYWDGFQAEFTTIANGCMGYHSDSIRYGIEGIWTALKKHDPKARLSIKTVFDTPNELLRAAKPEHVAFGCMPSFNIYNMKGEQADGYQVFNRAAGGHIHLGCGELKPDVLERVVKAMDAVLGVACVSMFANFDDPRRRRMYGLAGEYRLPKHGLEYRVLSNAWLMHPMIANLVFDLARGAFSFGYQDFLKFWDGNEAETIECINTCNVELARKILNRNKDLFLQISDLKYQDTHNHIKDAKLARPLYVWNVIINGAESVIAEPHNIEKNWMLGEKWITHCNALTKNVYSNVFHRDTGHLKTKEEMKVKI